MESSKVKLPDSKLIKENIKSGEWVTFECTNGRSDVWKCFLKIKEAETDESIPIVLCRFCNKHYKFPKGCTTSNLIPHKCYKTKFASPESSAESPKKKQCVEVPDHIRKNILNNCVDFVSQDLRSFEAVKGSGFKSLAENLIKTGAQLVSSDIEIKIDIDDLLPHPTTVSRHVRKRHEEELKAFVEKLRPLIIKGDCAATIDIWTEETTQISYLTFTVHYIDEDWELHSRIFFTIPLEKFDENGAERSITGDFITSTLKSKFTELGLGADCFDKFTYTTDQGSNVIKALKDCQRMNCSAHLLNTILRNTFDSSKLKEHATSISELMNKCKSLVEYLKRTGKKRILKYNVVQENKTRWNTKFDMLMSIERNFSEIEEVLAEAKESGRITCIDRELLNKVIMVLEPFKTATKNLEGDKNPTLCKVMFRVFILRDQLKGLLQDEKNKEVKYILKRCIDVVIPEKMKLADEHKISALFWPSMKQLRYLNDLDINREDCWAALETAMTVFSEPSNSVNEASSSASTSSAPTSPASTSSASSGMTTDENYYHQFKDVDLNLESGVMKVELESYRNFSTTNVETTDILSWWRVHASKFPYLSQLAKKYLAIPATSASSERSFSCAGRVIEKRRTKLKPENLDAVLFLHSRDEDAKV